MVCVDYLVFGGVKFVPCLLGPEGEQGEPLGEVIVGGWVGCYICFSVVGTEVDAAVLLELRFRLGILAGKEFVVGRNERKTPRRGGQTVSTANVWWRVGISPRPASDRKSTCAAVSLRSLFFCYPIGARFSFSSLLVLLFWLTTVGCADGVFDTGFSCHFRDRMRMGRAIVNIEMFISEE